MTSFYCKNPIGPFFKWAEPKWYRARIHKISYIYFFCDYAQSKVNVQFLDGHHSHKQKTTQCIDQKTSCCEFKCFSFVHNILFFYFKKKSLLSSAFFLLLVHFSFFVIYLSFSACKFLPCDDCESTPILLLYSELHSYFSMKKKTTNIDRLIHFFFFTLSNIVSLPRRSHSNRIIYDTHSYIEMCIL